MVRKYSLLKKSAFTMIELIFAIVIIAISVMSLPMLTQTGTKGIENNLIQETIFATGAILNESTTYYWDVNSMNDQNTTAILGLSRVVNTGVADCIIGPVPSRRVGHISRRCLDDNTTRPNPLGNSGISIEQAAVDYTDTTILTDNTSKATYKNSYSATVSVNSCILGGCTQFGATANNPNIKEIEIVVTQTGSTETLVMLKAYTANIGEAIPSMEPF